MYTFVKTQTIHLKRKIFILYELYKNIFNLKKVLWLIFYLWGSISIEVYTMEKWCGNRKATSITYDSYILLWALVFFCCKWGFIIVSQICSQEIFRMLHVFWKRASTIKLFRKCSSKGDSQCI